MTARSHASDVARAAPDRLPLRARALLGAAVAIAAVAPVLFGAYAFTAVGGPEFLTWMATWGTPIAFAACTAIIAIRVHDGGKLAIPREILDKPGPLDDAEWEIMRRHTVIGERMLSAAPAMAAIAPLVRSSHERWDGRGCPDGLAGREIPLGALIVAVCDSFDAMVSDRPYRRGMPAAEALAELRRCAGMQFDPDVVEAFVGIAGETLGLTPPVALAGGHPLRVIPSS